MNVQRIPTRWVIVIFAVVAFPSLFNLAGVDFSSPTGDASAGPFTHTLLEWSAVSTAFFTGLLALVHFKIKGDVATPVIGVALFAAGAMDAFHVLAADRLIESIADNRQFIPFTWAISRFFNAAIMLVGVGIVLRRRKMPGPAGFRFILFTTLAFGVLAYAIIGFCATTAQLPVTVFPDAVIKRPYDIPALALYVVAGAVVYPRFFRREPSIFTHALMISVIPDIATQFHMVFWSSALFDNSFNVAHFLKILAYMLPFAGLALDYVNTHEVASAQTLELAKINLRLEAEMAERQQANAEAKSLARFAAENPSPVLRSAPDGSVLYANQPALRCLRTLEPAADNTLPTQWCSLVREALQSGMPQQLETVCDDRTYVVVFAPIVDAGYVNLYGLDITERKGAEAKLAVAREQEVRIGSEIQDVFLHGTAPRFMRGVAVDYVIVPAQRMGGDFVDFSTHSGRYLNVLVGDVMGKGIPAALLGAAIKSRFVRDLSSLLSASDGQVPQPVDIVASVHRGVTRRLLELESFTTACYARFDLQDRRLSFVNCGHPQILHYDHATKTCAALEGGNLPLGFLEDYVYQESSCTFAAGDVFVLYSDGATETRNADGEMFGEARLAECVTSVAHLAPTDLVRKLRDVVLEFAGKPQPDDDLTLIAVRIGEPVIAHEIVRRDVTVARDLKQLTVVRDMIDGFCSDTFGDACPVRYVNELKLAVQEVVTNIIRHATTAADDGPIHIELDGFVNRTVLSLTYEGSAFDPEVVSWPVIEERPEGGLGLFLIAQSVDTVHYTRLDDGRNRINLVKFLPT